MEVLRILWFSFGFAVFLFPCHTSTLCPDGLPGTPGATGKTVYGPRGRNGEAGKDGKDGKDGVQGKPGIRGGSGPHGHIGAQGDMGWPGLPGECDFAELRALKQNLTLLLSEKEFLREELIKRNTRMVALMRINIDRFKKKAGLI